MLCILVSLFFFFKQKTAYEMRISDWSSDVCSSDLIAGATAGIAAAEGAGGIAKIRIGQFAPAVTRLVIDLARPMTLADASASAEKTELVVTLTPTDAAGFARYAKAPECCRTRQIGRAHV